MDSDHTLHVLKNIEPTAAETEVITLQRNASISRMMGSFYQRTLTWAETDPVSKFRTHSMHVIGVDKPGVVRSLVSLPDYNHARIIWTDEASGLILMNYIQEEITNTSLLAVWI